MLPRRTVTVETTVRQGSRQGRRSCRTVGKRWKSEHEDILALARARGESYLMLKDAVDAEIAKWMND